VIQDYINHQTPARPNHEPNETFQNHTLLRLHRHYVHAPQATHINYVKSTNPIIHQQIRHCCGRRSRRALSCLATHCPQHPRLSARTIRQTRRELNQSLVRNQWRAHKDQPGPPFSDTSFYDDTLRSAGAALSTAMKQREGLISTLTNSSSDAIS
jgi:hypothetical protein